MRQLQQIIRILAVVSAVWLTALVNQQSADVALPHYSPKSPESAVMTPHQQRHQEATLTDATQLYRICNTRPQRIVPTHGSNPKRTFNPATGFAWQHIVKPLNFLHDGKWRLDTAPFCTHASRDYYVIALRHIIR